MGNKHAQYLCIVAIQLKESQLLCACYPSFYLETLFRSVLNDCFPVKYYTTCGRDRCVQFHLCFHV